MKKILITGANGQLGTELSAALQEKYGHERIIDSDIKTVENRSSQSVFIELDVLDYKKLVRVVKEHSIDEIYHLAAILSANAEKYPERSWEINMKGLLHILDLGREGLVNKIFWPSSIAVFGPSTPRENTPQDTIMDPTTVYGISKLAGERWCQYFHDKFNVDIRSLRYPGIISYKTLPGGGTTDYAVDIFYHAVKNEKYKCFLREDTRLPMMYIEDAVRATLELMEAKTENISIHSSYNLAAISFSPGDIYREIRKILPDFQASFNPDFRQKIADSWPSAIDDSKACDDWGWKHNFELKDIAEVMVRELYRAC